ncbi:DALR anticodon-binding domain-containing protein [Trichocoleus desertorum AS-A10]|uniref:DALR anticodon-binding domain-containing protein n=1 Tax=Trichocoleus desertorum TaxID=1481672 RepID=UPI003299515B
MTHSRQTYLDSLAILSEQLPSTTDLRCTIAHILKSLLQETDHTLEIPRQQDLNSKIFFNTLKTHHSVYQASMSRQFAVELPSGIEETALKDEPKDWFIKTADFGDDCDRILQHRDGQFTQLFEDLARYHAIFQEGYDKIVLLRPPTYIGYDRQLTAAMQCLRYTKEQFQFIIVQPLKLYAFHQPTQQVHAIPDLAVEELLKVVSMDTLRWYSLRVPLTDVAPINISTAGQPTPVDSLYCVQSAYARCSVLLKQADEQGFIQINTSQKENWQTSSTYASIAESFWDSLHAEKLADQLQSTSTVLQQAAAEIAPHLVCQHLESISAICHQWLENIELTQQVCMLLLAAKQTIYELLENILEIQALESIQGKVTKAA